MSSTGHWYQEGAAAPPPSPASASGVNGLGLAGFIIGLVGLCGSGGMLSPLGLLLSLLGLMRAPRGFAVAGTIVGALGTCCCFPWILPFALVLVGILSIGAAIGWIAGIASVFGGPTAVSWVRASFIAFFLSSFYAQHGSLPTSLDELDLGADVVQDAWGRPFQYRVTDDPEGFVLTSPGADNAPGTADDVEMRGEVRGGRLDIEPAGRAGRNRGGNRLPTPADPASGPAPDPASGPAPGPATKDGPAPGPAPGNETESGPGA